MVDPPLRGARDVRGTPKAPSLRRGLMVDATRGVARVRKWPSPRGPARNPAVRQWVDFLRFGTMTWNVLPAAFRQACERDAAGMPWMPRDLHIASLRGRLFAIVLDNGRTIYPMAAVMDVSQSLDVIGQDPGDLLVRGEERWQPLPAGSPGTVLTIDPATGRPAWAELAPPDSVPPVQWAPAGAWAPSGTIPQHIAWAAGLAGWQLRDAATDTLYLCLAVPPDTAAVIVRPVIVGGATTTGRIRLRVTAAGAITGQPIGTPATWEATVTLQTGRRMHTVESAALALSPSAPELVLVSVARLGTHAQDDLTDTAYLIGGEVEAQ